MNVLFTILRLLVSPMPSLQGQELLFHRVANRRKHRGAMSIPDHSLSWIRRLLPHRNEQYWDNADYFLAARPETPTTNKNRVIDGITEKKKNSLSVFLWKCLSSKRRESESKTQISKWKKKIKQSLTKYLLVSTGTVNTGELHWSAFSFFSVEVPKYHQEQLEPILWVMCLMLAHVKLQSSVWICT